LRRPVQGPGAAATFEAGLDAFHRAGLDRSASYAAVKSVALGILGCCVEQAYAASGAEELRTDVTQLSWQQFPMLHEVATSDDDVDVVAALREVLVAGLASKLTMH